MKLLILVVADVVQMFQEPLTRTELCEGHAMNLGLSKDFCMQQIFDTILDGVKRAAVTAHNDPLCCCVPLCSNPYSNFCHASTLTAVANKHLTCAGHSIALIS